MASTKRTGKGKRRTVKCTPALVRKVLKAMQEEGLTPVRALMEVTGKGRSTVKRWLAKGREAVAGGPPSEWATLMFALAEFQEREQDADDAVPDGQSPGPSGAFGGPAKRTSDTELDTEAAPDGEGVQAGQHPGDEENNGTASGGKLTTAVIEAAVRYIGNGTRPKRAVELAANVTPQTRRRWWRLGIEHTEGLYRQMYLAVHQITNSELAIVEAKAMELAKKGNPSMVRFVLSNWDPTRWKVATTKQVEHTGTVRQAHEGQVRQAHEGTVEVAGHIDVEHKGLTSHQVEDIANAHPDALPALLAKMMEQAGAEPVPEALGAQGVQQEVTSAPAPAAPDADPEEDEHGNLPGDPDW